MHYQESDMARRLILHGRVQGVCCRQYCSIYARNLGLRGAATNLYDGTVEVLLDTDDRTEIERYISALESNPRRVQFYGMIESIDSADYSGTIRGDYRF